MEPSLIKEICTKVLNKIAILQSQKAIALESFIKNPLSNTSICKLRPESLEILLESISHHLVTNFKVALIKKLWQCSMLSCTLHVAIASPPAPTLGEGECTATHRLPRDPCDISIGLSCIPLDNICI